jgi:hypothetical protein
MATEPEKIHEVSGLVTGQGGAPLYPARVVVWWQRIRERRELATGKTDHLGRYRIRYPAPNRGGEPTLVVIEATSPELKTPLISSSTVAQPELQVDLAYAPADQSVWTRLMREIEPQLEGMGLTDLVENTVHQDLTFLSIETGETAEELMQVAVAARLGAANGLPAPLFFAFLRQQIPSNLPQPLLEASSQFALIDALVKNIATMIFALSPDEQKAAITGAIALDLIDQRFTPDIDAWVARLQALRTTDILSQPYVAGGASLAELLQVANIPQAQQQIFASALAANTQSMSDFWNTLGTAGSGLTPEGASSIERVLSIGGFVNQYIPLIQNLQADFQSGRFTTLSQLATVSLADWTTRIGTTGAPANIEPAGNQSAAAVFAANVYNQVTSAYPTAALTSRIAQFKLFGESDRNTLTQFFNNNPGLELITQSLPAYLAAQGQTAFQGIDPAQQPAVIANARILQRVLRVAPNVDAAQALIGLELTSATQINGLGRQQFSALATAQGLTLNQADTIFETAAQRYASVVATYMRYNTDAMGPLPKMVMDPFPLNQAIQTAVQGDASLATLFGSQDYCLIADCTSVLSPAAYLCDLLLWLRNHNQGGHTALDVLDGRRPDIRNLLLNCPNTDVELPYIDLVIELLADKISPPTDPNSTLNPIWKQTGDTATAEQLRAAPEYFNQNAFVTLSQASYPQSLPYSAGLDELRTYLQQWNLPLWQLREALLPLAGANPAQLADVAAERLGMNDHALELTTTANAVPAATAWGTTDFSSDAAGLANVPIFLTAGGLTYDELAALLQSAWVQGGLGIQITGLNDTCDTSQMALSPAPLDPGFLDRAHRFIRLWLSASYAVWELDLLLLSTAVGAGTLDESALARLHGFWKLQARTRLPVDQQLAFYQPIDTDSHADDTGNAVQSLYTRLFLNPTTTWIAPDADMAGLANGTAPGDPVLANHAKAIQPALGVTSADLVKLFAFTDGQLNLANLSLIWRINALAKAASLSITDLTTVAQLLRPGMTAVDALSALLASPADTLTFLDQAADLRAAPFSLDALTYLLTPPGPDGWTTTSQMTDQDIASALSSVQAAAAQLTSDTGDMDGVVVSAMAASAMPANGSSLAADVTAVLLNTLVPGTGQTLLKLLQDANLLSGAQPLSRTNFPNQFIGVQLFDKAALIVRSLKFNADEIAWFMANAGLYGGVDIAGLPVASAANAQALGPLLNTLDLVKLDRGFNAAPPGSTPATLLDLLGGINSGAVADEYAAQTALASLSGWPLSDIQAFTPALGLIFPASYFQPQAYDALRTLEVMSQAVQASGSAPPATTVLATAITDVQTTVTVASAIGFPAPDFYVSIGAEILRVTAFGGADNTVWTVARGQQGSTAATAAAGAAVLATYGAQLVAWGGVPADELAAQALAASALGALKAQQTSDAAWLTVASSLMDPIRQRRADALRTYLISQRDASGTLIYGDADGLFNYFLIDIQMSPCQVTSRVVQAYIAVQIFVERCFMNLETTLWNSSDPGVTVNPLADDTWSQWQWMSRYRIWEANREVFLYPENWLIESERPNRTEIYQKFEQEVRQGTLTRDYLETTVLNYIDRLDGLAHLLVTGTYQDSQTGAIYVVARSLSDPPTFYIRSCVNQAWTGWTQIMADIKAHQAIPAVYRGRVCVFWMDVKVSNEPHQATGVPRPSDTPPSQQVDLYVTLGVNFTVLRDGTWSPAQSARGKLFDKPIYDSTVQATDTRSIESLYTIKIQTPAQPASSDYGASLFIEVFRQPPFYRYGDLDFATPGPQTHAQHIGRAVFDGRFSDLALTDTYVPSPSVYNVDYSGYYVIVGGVPLLEHAKATYGPDAQLLIPLTAPDPDLQGDSGLLPTAGALSGFPTATGSSSQPIPLYFTSTNLSQTNGPLLNTLPLPARVVGPCSDLNIDPESYFFVQENRHAWFVESTVLYWHFIPVVYNPVVPGDQAAAVNLAYSLQYLPIRLWGPYEITYYFKPFYHPFTRLMWNQLSAGGFDLLYDPKLQRVPDSIDPSYSDVFSFEQTYQPTSRVSWDLADASTVLAAPVSANPADPGYTQITVRENIWVPKPGFFVTLGSEVMQVTAVSGQDGTHWTVTRAQNGTAAAGHAAGDAVTPLAASQDRQFLDFSPSGAFSVYNWELFYHIPNYVAQLLSQNLQFEDARAWLHYIFNPTRQGVDPTPQRFWTPKPLHALSAAQIQAEAIANLLSAVNQGDPAAVAQVQAWRQQPFNPFALADLRPVAYMKSTVMSYLDNLIAWADNLFASDSREALSEATLIYVIAQEILGPTPTAIRPPTHADMSYDQLEPSLDAFANAMVDIENVIGPGSGGTGSGATGGGIPAAQTFYFKIPPNEKLLGYWSTVADRLYKLRHCQDISGAALQLALFDAPIDPGLLIAARAAGVDLSSVLADLGAPLPNYRFTALYSQASDFVGAVRAYGTALQAALTSVDAGALALLQQTTAQQLLRDGDQILDWQVQQAQAKLDAQNEALNLAQQKYNFNSSQDTNAWETTSVALHADAVLIKTIGAALQTTGGVTSLTADFALGGAGVGGTPLFHATFGGSALGRAAHMAGLGYSGVGDLMELLSSWAKTASDWIRRQQGWDEAAAEAQIQINQANDQIHDAEFALQIAQQNQVLHQEQIDNIQKQIDFLTDKFTSNSLYDWIVSSLSATYFQSYRLAYQMCKQVERCYQFELGVQDSSFIQFGYWDSLHKGLLAGETLNHDLRRLQASYLALNQRRFELSRFVSLGSLTTASGNPLQDLLVKGSCDFDLTEALFDGDYPGHYNRRLTRVSVSVVYPSPGKFDNIKATLTLVANKVRIQPDLTGGYAEAPGNNDPRFIYSYAANAQKIATGNAQDDPGLFISAIASNIADQRYLPFENAGAVSSWHLEMPQLNNEVDLSTVGDVVLHLYYTALDGGADLQAAASQAWLDSLPTSGIKVFSALNDFAAPTPTAANPYPLTPWQAFVASGATQKLILTIAPAKFPAWTRGHTLTVNAITLLTVGWPPGNFVLAPQAPLPTALLTMTPVAGVTEPNVCTATINIPGGTALGQWTFELQKQGAPDFQSLTKNDPGDLLLLVHYSVS